MDKHLTYSRVIQSRPTSHWPRGVSLPPKCRVAEVLGLRVVFDRPLPCHVDGDGVLSVFYDGPEFHVLRVLRVSDLLVLYDGRCQPGI